MDDNNDPTKTNGSSHSLVVLTEPAGERNQLTRSDFINLITHDLDNYSGLSFTPDEAKEIRRQLRTMSTGAISMLPLVCAAEECPFASRCVFMKMGKIPRGNQCLIELNLLREWRVFYFDEYEVDPNSFTEVTIINELAELEVLLWRLNMSLSKPENAELIQENTVGVDKRGNPVTQKQPSSLLDARDKLLNRKSKLIKMMVGDRQEKYKRESALKRREEKDPSQTMSELRKKLEHIQRELNQKQKDLESKAGVLDLEEATTLPTIEVPKGRHLYPDDVMNADEE